MTPIEQKFKNQILEGYSFLYFGAYTQTAAQAAEKLVTLEILKTTRDNLHTLENCKHFKTPASDYIPFFDKVHSRP